MDRPVDVLTSGTLTDVQPQDEEDSSAQPESIHKQAVATPTVATGGLLGWTLPRRYRPFDSFRGHGWHQVQRHQLLTSLQKCIIVAKNNFMFEAGVSSKWKGKAGKVFPHCSGLTRVLTESSSERASWSQDSLGL